MGFMLGNDIHLANSGKTHVVKLPSTQVGQYGLVDMEFGDAAHGWLHVYGDQQQGRGRGYASFTAWIKTDDGGATFTPLLLNK